MRALLLSLLVPLSSYGAGKIVNADIAASGTANIARNKLAAGTAYAWCVNDVSGFEADTAVTASRAVVTDVNGAPVASATTATELGFVSGVTSAIQTQLNGKQASGNYITALTGDVTASGPGSVAATVAQIQGTAVSGTTGTTNVVFSASPTLVTPTLGAASATTINKVTLTAPATGSTLTIADGKTLTCNNTLTLAGTDGSTLNIGAGGTLGSAAFTSSGAYASSTLTNTHILVGNVSNVATDVAASGDLTLANTGSFTIANSAVTNAKIANSTIDLTAKVTGTLPFGNGGTGQSSYIDGQLLIGNSSTGGLTGATLSAGANITITNGNGSISIAASGGGGGGGGAQVAFSGFTGFSSGCANQVWRYSTTVISSGGTDISVNDSTTLGTQFTALTSGLYDISFNYGGQTGGSTTAIMVNDPSCTTVPTSQSASTTAGVLATCSASGTGVVGTCHAFAKLSANDVITIKTNVTGTSISNDMRTIFHMIKASN